MNLIKRDRKIFLDFQSLIIQMKSILTQVQKVKKFYRHKIKINIQELKLKKLKIKKRSLKDIHHKNQDRTKKEKKTKKRKKIKREVDDHLQTKVQKNKEKTIDNSMIRDQDKRKLSEKLYKDKYSKGKLLEQINLDVL